MNLRRWLSLLHEPPMDVQAVRVSLDLDVLKRPFKRPAEAEGIRRWPSRCAV
jgi:hypothetical protein